MKTSASLGLAALIFASSLTGCGPRMLLPSLFALRVATTAAVVAAATSRPRVIVVEERVDYGDGPVIVREAPPPLVAVSPPETPPAPPSLPGFDPVAAHGAVESVDVSSCWAPGSAHGYGTARVTFNPSGTVELVEVVNPAQAAAVDATCVSQRYGALSLPAFSGGPVAVTGRFFVG